MKPCIQITMKGPSRKHVIIPISNDNNIKFMKNSSIHVANINRALRNVKIGDSGRLHLLRFPRYHGGY